MIVCRPPRVSTLSVLAISWGLFACSGGSAANSAGKASAPASGSASAPTAAASAGGAEAIRAVLQQRFERLPPVDSIEPTTVPGLWEVRIGTEVVYTDSKGDHLIKGEIIETTSKRNLTEERVNKLSAIDFASLPLDDAIVWKNGTGERKIAVFADPNCGYCKRFEQGLAEVKNVTVYTFLYPILGGDSPQKIEAVWCSKDRAAAWTALMRQGKAAQKSMGKCDTPMERNLALGQKHRITGTPAIVFEDGTRIPGALSPQALEEQLQKAAAAAAKKS